MIGYVFVFVCVAFSCHGTPLPGDGALYANSGECKRAAHLYAAKHAITLGRYEISCVMREQ